MKEYKKKPKKTPPNPANFQVNVPKDLTKLVDLEHMEK